VGSGRTALSEVGHLKGRKTHMISGSECDSRESFPGKQHRSEDPKKGEQVL
jgi:hypothetical protein